MISRFYPRELGVTRTRRVLSRCPRRSSGLAAPSNRKLNQALTPSASAISSSSPSTRSTATTTGSTSRTDHTLTLRNGRILSYALYGPANGRPVIFLHGTPSCRLEANGISSSGLLDKTGVRLIVPDRPGFGLSSPAKSRTVLSYVNDLEALITHIGLEHDGQDSAREDGQRPGGYAVIGGSGGGPYATACAFEASRSPRRFANMYKVGLFAAAPPYISPIPVGALSVSTLTAPAPEPTTQYIRYNPEQDTRLLQRDWMIKSKLVFELARRYPTLSRAMTNIGINGTAWLWNTQRGRRSLEKYVEAFLSEHAPESPTSGLISQDTPSDKDTSPASRRALMDEEVASFIALSQETWRQGPDGWLDEVRLLGASWGFDPSRIRVRASEDRSTGLSMKVWHGAKDVNAPLAPMRWLVDRIEGARLVVVEGKGHFGLGETLEEMLRWAADTDSPRKYTRPA